MTPFQEDSLENAKARRRAPLAGALLLLALPAFAQRVVVPQGSLPTVPTLQAPPALRLPSDVSALNSTLPAYRAIAVTATLPKPAVPAVAGSPVAAEAQPAGREGLLAAACRITRELVARHLARRRDGTTVTKVLASNDTKTITEYAGVPGRIEKLETANKVYRHWIKDEETLRKIVESGVLRSGETSYVDFTGSKHAFIKDIYPELHGAFFTTPAHSAGESRVMNWEVPYYVDFIVPEGIEALRLDGDEVLMFPAPTGTLIPIEIVGTSQDPR
ncbi:MAG: hypothetical protein WC969_02275 [Elusimicrobiota bacterium]|jgi:hypothetical protein